jgi:hypothetical protein
MSKPIDNEAAPVVSTLLRQGWLPDESEALELIDQSEARVKSDALWSLAATGVSLASACGMLAVATIQAPIVIPVIGAMGCLMTAWNSRQTEIYRTRESEFLAEFPEVLKLIEAKADGSNDEQVATAYDRTLKAWLYGELDNVGRFLGAAPSVELKDIPIDDSPIPETPMNAESGEFPSLNGDNAKAENPTQQAIQPPMQAQGAPTEPAKAGLPGFIAEMSHAVRSSLIVGIPGAGKGLSTAVLIQHVKKYRPELRIFGIDPKNDPKESGYWQGYTAADRFDAELLDGWEIQSRLDAMLNQFNAAGEDALLVVDEFATVIGCCDRKWVESFNAKLQKIVQMGNSKNRFLWIISQSGNLAELKLQSSLRSSLELLAIVRPGSDAAIASLIKTDLIADKDTERMQAMMQRSPVGRAYYYRPLQK